VAVSILSQWDVATLLRDCALNAVDHTGPLTISRVCVVPGEISWDDCQCGQLAVAEQRRYPSMDFPLEEVNHEADCGAPWLVSAFIISLARCVPVPSVNGSPPDCTALEASAQQLATDMLKLRKGVQCCLDAAYNAHTVEAWELGASEVNGPQGQCVETTLTVLVGWTNDCGC
jgi:hypothetical protein